ncbi:uncharacterized protein [Penaeus vannamei]|uniref:uncharacterized protein n=1 Tax=Penaeus vannamei TaxID=6689 RepID=UPI00387F4213
MTEKRLLKLGLEYAKAYNNQIREMIVCDVARQLTPDKFKDYAGPVTYIQHHEVLKPGSTSTPLRIVFDSSAKYMGQSLNSFWAKGPDILNSMMGILLRFRERAIGIAGDLSKMYNSIKLPEMEQHVHGFVWRNFRSDCEPEHYVLMSMGFGEKPSGIIVMLALKHTAELSMGKYPDAASMMISNSYVDDIIHSVDSKEKALQLIRETEEILSDGDLKVKQWIMTGDAGVRTEPDLNILNFFDNVPSDLTKKVVVSQMCSVYDLRGLLLTYTLKAKMLLREAPPSAVDLPMLVIFSDSSSNAYGALAYARWKLKSGTFETTVRAQIQKESHGFRTFIATRIAEVQSKSNPSEWWWVASDHNPADLLTRPNNPSDIKISSLWKYNKLIAVTGRILDMIKLRSLNGIFLRLEPEILKEAEQFWIMQAQKCLSDDWKQKYQRLGPYKTEDGTIMIIILCKLQTKFWVPSARKIIKSVKCNSVTFRRLDFKVEGQSMGQVAAERMNPCPAFYHTATDIFGPFQIRDSVKKRTTGKAYGVIFNCMVSRAVYIDVVDGCDTHSFLKTFRRFRAVHGYPATVHSDLGSQLVSASRELEIAINNWNMSDISEFGANRGLKWIFNRSADGAWQNGVSESLIKSVKRSLSMIIGSSVTT